MLVFPCIPDGQHVRLNDQLRWRIVLVTFSIVPRLRLVPSLCHLPDQPLHTHPILLPTDHFGDKTELRSGFREQALSDALP
jgi:hypothetical protein